MFVSMLDMIFIVGLAVWNHTSIKMIGTIFFCQAWIVFGLCLDQNHAYGNMALGRGPPSCTSCSKEVFLQVSISAILVSDQDVWGKVAGTDQKSLHLFCRTSFVCLSFGFVVKKILLQQSHLCCVKKLKGPLLVLIFIVWCNSSCGFIAICITSVMLLSGRNSQILLNCNMSHGFIVFEL